MPFQKGQSGNPKGRTPGKSKVGKLRALLEPHSQALIDKAVTMALDGDVAALRLCLERLVPPLKCQDTTVTLGDLPDSLPEQGTLFLQTMSEGKITPEQTAKLLTALAAQSRIVEVEELARRMAMMEDNLAKLS